VGSEAAARAFDAAADSPLAGVGSPLTAADTVLVEDAEFALGHSARASALMLAGRIPDAREGAARAVELAASATRPDSGHVAHIWVHAKFEAGEHTEVLGWLAECRVARQVDSMSYRRLGLLVEGAYTGLHKVIVVERQLVQIDPRGRRQIDLSGCMSLQRMGRAQPLMTLNLAAIDGHVMTTGFGSKKPGSKALRRDRRRRPMRKPDEVLRLRWDTGHFHGSRAVPRAACSARSPHRRRPAAFGLMHVSSNRKTYGRARPYTPGPMRFAFIYSGEVGGGCTLSDEMTSRCTMSSFVKVHAIRSSAITSGPS